MDYHPTHHLNLQKEAICMIGWIHNDPLRNIIPSFAVSLLQNWQLSYWSSYMKSIFWPPVVIFEDWIVLFSIWSSSSLGNTNDYLKFLLIFLLFLMLADVGWWCHKWCIQLNLACNAELNKNLLIPYQWCPYTRPYCVFIQQAFKDGVPR